MTIKDKIIEGLLIAGTERLNALKDMGAPNIIIVRQEKYVTDLTAGILKVGGDNNLLAEQFENMEVSKGRGGKTYYIFNNGDIKFYPQAKYGMFITK